jgi:hypothetical protein
VQRIQLIPLSNQVDDQPQPMNYVQVFNLQQASGSYYVFNDVFRCTSIPAMDAKELANIE